MRSPLKKKNKTIVIASYIKRTHEVYGLRGPG